MFTVAVCVPRKPLSTALVIGLGFSSAAAPSRWIEMRSIAPCASCPTRLPSFSASPMYGRSLGASSADRLGMFSALMTPPETR